MKIDNKRYSINAQSPRAIFTCLENEPVFMKKPPLSPVWEPFTIRTGHDRFDSSLIFTIENAPIKQVSSTKSLGIYIYEKVSWNLHKMIASGTGTLKRSRPFSSFDKTLLSMCNSLVRSHLDYCSVVWVLPLNYKTTKSRSSHLNFPF